MKNKKLNHRSQKALGLVEVALGLSLAMIGIMAVIHLDGLKNKYLKANRESGELRDLRAYLQRKVSCPNTISDPACTTTANSQISAKSCNSQNITNSQAPTKIGNFEVKVSCGTNYGSDRMFVEYRPFQNNTVSAWKDLNRGIPWTCSAGGEEGYNWSDLKISSEFMCGLSNGDVYCWGQNYMGALGDPSKDIVLPYPVGANGRPPSAVRNDCPVKVMGLQNPVSKIIAGEMSVCAKDASNLWKCWGGVEPSNGLPIVPYTNSYVQEVMNLGNFVSKSPRSLLLNLNLDSVQNTVNNGLCVTDAFGVRCYYSLSQTLATINDVKIPNIPAGSVTKISGSGDNGCALYLGGVACWEKLLNTNPQFPPTNQYDDSWMWPVTSINPIGPNQGKNIVDIFGTKASGCATNSSNEVWCWGTNSMGQLGIGNYSTPSQATKVTNLSTSVLSGLYATSANRCLLQDDAVKCWGKHPILFSFPNTNLTAPTSLQGFDSNMQKLYCGGTSSSFKCCAVHQNQELNCFGHNRGQTIDPSQSNTASVINKKLLEMCQNNVWKINPSATGGGTSSCTP